MSEVWGGNECSQDGMDQSKWAVPRCQQLTKALAKHDRPRAKIQGVWLHNVALCMDVLDVRQATDASMVVECLAKAMEKMWSICLEQGKSGPKRILLWVSRRQVHYGLQFVHVWVSFGGRNASLGWLVFILYDFVGPNLFS